MFREEAIGLIGSRRPLYLVCCYCRCPMQVTVGLMTNGLICSILFYPTAVYAWYLYKVNGSIERDEVEGDVETGQGGAREEAATESTPLLNE
jgi:hypothetical protein